MPEYNITFTNLNFSTQVQADTMDEAHKLALQQYEAQNPSSASTATPTSDQSITRVLVNQHGSRVRHQCLLTAGTRTLEEDNLDGNELIYAEDGTRHDYDNQRLDYQYGEALFLDEAYNPCLAGDLIIETTTEDDDGNETISTEPFTGGIQAPFEPEIARNFSKYGRATRALELARWVTASKAISMDDPDFINPITHQRIKTRAFAYARAEGVIVELERILNSTHPELLV